MKKLTLIIISLTVASANAASVTYDVSGSLGSWRSWNASSANPVPYATALAGIDLVQGTANGAAVGYGPYLDIDVAGSITYDDTTGAISALTLSQVGSFTGWYDTDADGLTDDSVTFSNLSWALSGTNVSQTSGTAIGCDSASPICAFTVAGVNANDHSNGTGQSVFDFQGINAGFLTRPRSNATETAYGTDHYINWAATAGGSGNVTVQAGDDVAALALASRVNSGIATTNAANLATLNLIVEEAPAVPVPAAAWLMSSGLVGLAGVARRRRPN